MEQLYEIYLITNLKNNKHYVGQTKLGRHEERWDEHKKDSKHYNRILYNALKKDAINNYINFKFEVIEKDIPEKLIDQKEIDYIKLYNSYYGNKQGYNMTFGGQGVHGYIFTDEDKEKISKNSKLYWAKLKEDKERYSALCQHRSEVLKGRVFSLEHRAKISKWASTRIGAKNSFYGKHFSEESLQKLKQSKREKSRKVTQFDLQTGTLITIFNGFSEAVEQLNLPRSAIARIKSVCDLGHGHAYNFIWRYADTVKNISSIELNREHKNPRAKPVIQLDLNGNKITEFVSAAEASRLFSDNYKAQRCIAKHINEVCLNTKGRKSCKGFIWKYK